MKRKLHLATGLAIVLSSSLSAQTFTDTIRVDYSGGPAQVTIPSCVRGTIKMVLVGGSGASGNGPMAGTGGMGTVLEQLVAEGEYQPGLILTVEVGGAAVADIGGYNGGGNGVNTAGGISGGGGGATDVRVGADIASRILVAAGGGGGGVTGCDPDTPGGNGGNGGSNGTNGGDTPTPNSAPVGNAGGGAGGNGANGGAAGIGCGGFLGAPGANGILGFGGNGGGGQTCCCFATSRHPHGGGGGGGYTGGGAGGGGSAGTTGCSGNDKGAGGGGAGGTNLGLVASFYPTVYDVAATSGNGYFLLIYNDSLPVTTSSDTTVCLGDDFTLSASAGNGVTYSWDTPNADTTATATVSGATAGVHTYNVTATNDVCAGYGSVTVTVQDCAGVGEMKTAAFNCYPNPVVNTLEIAVKSNETINTLEVFDAAGKIIYTEKGLNTDKLTVNTGLWKKGNYTIRINKSFTQSIIKQ